MKENPQVQQVWIQVKIMMCFLGFIGLLVSYDVCVDNAQNKRLDCPQLQCIVIFSFDTETGFVKNFYLTIISQAPIGAEEVEMLRVVGQFFTVNYNQWKGF